MTPGDAVLIDALREQGLARVTLWDLRCIDSFAAANLRRGDPGWLHALIRLSYDLQYRSMDGAHKEALAFDSQRESPGRAPEQRGGLTPHVCKGRRENGPATTRYR